MPTCRVGAPRHRREYVPCNFRVQTRCQRERARVSSTWTGIDHQADFAACDGKAREPRGRRLEQGLLYSKRIYDLHAIKQMNRNIRLIRYANGGDMVVRIPELAIHGRPGLAPLHPPSMPPTRRSPSSTRTPPMRCARFVDEVRRYMASPIRERVSSSRLRKLETSHSRGEQDA